MNGNNSNIESVLVTGASGFLGSSIVERLVNEGYSVAALVRSSSDLNRCVYFRDRVRWIKCEKFSDAEMEIIKFKPGILIHAAWNGVKASDRDNWTSQAENLTLFASILELTVKAGINKVIALGSQAEYGFFNDAIDETHECDPNTAYGAAKLSACTFIKSFSKNNHIAWYWIRLFSIFGPGEDENWLIPSVINSLILKKELELTPCEQMYDYLYLKDFTTAILNVIRFRENKSGIYNLSGNSSLRIKDILSYIQDSLYGNGRFLKFGALPYRPNQIMRMEGNSNLFFNTFDYKPEYSVKEGLKETIEFYLAKVKKDNK